MMPGLWLHPLRTPGVTGALLKLGLATWAAPSCRAGRPVLPFLSSMLDALGPAGQPDFTALAQAMQGPLMVFGLFYVLLWPCSGTRPPWWAGMPCPLRRALFSSMVACWRNKYPIAVYVATWAAVFFGLRGLLDGLAAAGVSMALLAWLVPCRWTSWSRPCCTAASIPSTQRSSAPARRPRPEHASPAGHSSPRAIPPRPGRDDSPPNATGRPGASYPRSGLRRPETPDPRLAPAPSVCTTRHPGSSSPRGRLPTPATGIGPGAARRRNARNTAATVLAHPATLPAPEGRARPATGRVPAYEDLVAPHGTLAIRTPRPATLPPQESR